MERVSGGFSEEQFREACAELQQPAPAGADWRQLVETLGISIYRLLDQPTGLYAYKVFGVLDNCPPAVLADVYMDLDYRKQWDGYVEGNLRDVMFGETGGTVVEKSVEIGCLQERTLEKPAVHSDKQQGGL
ncbi:phosphatidylcholine transfer protein [Ailuropoda melanoleuca]|uniref:phosphatidylcholine transfer protein n=1 Tax=Ailuropoda melanoleuca TaxID=9646 RepID=UPI001494703C|nr:phosphatidylcholine transfer protein [Ailuropoda melanoleuca]